jgi:hypothetical protein
MPGLLLASFLTAFACAATRTAPAPAPLSGFTADLSAAVARSGLSPAQLDLIGRHAKAGRPLGIDEFLKGVPLEDNGYLLGITGGGVYDRAAEVTGLTPYREVYAERIGAVRTDATPAFLEHLTEAGDTVVFLVPPDALTHPEANMTKQELEWFFEHPERMKETHFVFGAYDAAGRDLAALRAGHRRPSDETRIAQRRRHLGDQGPVEQLSGARRQAAIDEFVAQMSEAEHVRERSSGKTYFQTERGFYVLQRAARGLFLRLSPEPGGLPREAFISRESEPELYERTRARIAGAL